MNYELIVYSVVKDNAKKLNPRHIKCSIKLKDVLNFYRLYVLELNILNIRCGSLIIQ